MFKNYLKIAWRNLLKNKVYSLINIAGLAIGMTATILIALWIFDELDRDNNFDNKATIAQVYQHQTINGRTGTGPAIPRPLEFALRKDYGDNFKHLIMSSWNQSRYLQFGDINLSFSGNFMQQGVADMLQLNIVKGDKDGLKDKSSILISESTAKALFNKQNPIGKIVKLDNRDNFSVVAVYEDLPESSSFSDTRFIAHWDFYLASQGWIENSKTRWGNNSFQMFAQINDNTTMEGVTAKIIDVKKKASPNEVEFNPQIFLLPMKDWYLRSNFENGVQTGGRIENVWLFGIIGAFVLLLACINFVNLSTARSEKRALEVGIRKSIGSKRGQLVSQFLSESFLIVVLAFVVAVGLTLLFLNGFNELAMKEITFPWLKGKFWLASFVFIIITSVLAGSYPALYLSSFNPVTVLKGTFKVGRYSSLPRKILVVGQFSVSVALIIGTLVVINQIDFAKNRPVGYNKEGLIQIPTFSSDFTGKAETIRTQFLASGAAVEMATTSSPTTQVWSNRSGYIWDGKPEGFQEDFAHTSVSYDFVEALGLKIIEGRAFSRDFPSDSTAVILNKTAVDYMGITDPIGKFIRDDSENDPAPPLKIIGVIDDMIVQSPYTPVKQAMYVFDAYGNFSYFNVRLNPEKSTSANLEIIERVFKENFPNLPFIYQFVDEQYGRKFRSQERVANLSQVFTILAIFISCLGLFGLASFVAEQRTKEIGVRKTLGASVSQLWMLLSKDFLKLVFISLIVGSPIAYYMMTKWLQKFPYRTDISWSVFVMACSGAIVITLLTVSYQAIKSATTNPVDSLRTE
ncbi:ABC transporter permease [Polaribacter porphyrae]|uniref:ABC transporter permease n=1 Tax=Polaribacter porphyrae TaxID=1137780 RepID=A0A2S7WNU6_9FLAO|nr:ABC transporter permease [Polaribacter porphyrae]PQJ79288.1 ABC transporter permease [Polaribacter porphyrae]